MEFLLETNRVKLRNFNLGDLDDFFEYCSKEGVGINAGWLEHKNIEESKKILDMMIEDKGSFAIVFKENNKVIGSISYRKTNKEDLKNTLYENDDSLFLEIGFVLSKEYWNKGIMTEVVIEFCSYLKNILGAKYITASYYNENIASKRVQEKAGFKYLKDKICKTTYGLEKKAKFNIK